MSEMEAKLRKAIDTVRGIDWYTFCYCLGSKERDAIELLANRVEMGLQAAERARFVDRVPQHTHLTETGPKDSCPACKQNARNRPAEDSPECGA